MTKELVLTFDIGTQSMRGMIVNKFGNILDFEQYEYEIPYYSSKPLWAEQKPNMYFEVMCKISQILKERNREIFESGLLALTITCFRDSVICLDSQNKPLRDIIMWLDKREANEEKLSPIPTWKKIVFALTKVTEIISTQRKQSICNWIMTEQPEIWKKTEKFVFLSSYLNYQLTGVLLDSKANQIGHLPFDAKKKSWEKNFCITRFIYDVPMEKLCPVCNSGEIIGKVTKEVSQLSGIPEGLELVATGSDKGCETLGLSVNSFDKAAVSFGTAATIQLSSSKHFAPQPYAPCYPAVVNEKWNPEIQIYRGYWMLNWFKAQFAQEEVAQAKKMGITAEKLLDSHLQEVPAGCGGLILQPFWGPGVCTPSAKGSVIGFYDGHSKYHFYRSIIEGIDYALYDGLKGMERRGKTKVNEIFVSGGGSKSPEVCQIASDVFGLPVSVTQTHETSGIGSSMVAFVSKGVFDNYDEAIKSMVHVTATYKPNLENHKIYEKYYNTVYKHMYRKLLPFYMTIKKMQEDKK